MLRFPLELARTVWALSQEYRPILTAVIARLLSGDRLGAEGLEAIRRERREFDARHAASPAAARGDTYFQRVPESESKTGDVAIVPVDGVIVQRGGIDADTSEPLASAQRIGQSVRAAAADNTVGGIVLDVDSPGGSVHGIEELAQTIFDARSVKPVFACANSLAASAAYWAASQATELFACPGAEVGSIGCFTVHFDLSEALAQAGVSPSVISSSPLKVETLPYGELGADARAHIQASVDSFHNVFTRAVARGRGTTLKAVENMGQGRTLLPEPARAANMIDGTLTLEQTVARMQAKLKARGKSAPRLPAPAPRAARLAALELEVEVLKLSVS